MKKTKSKGKNKKNIEVTIVKSPKGGGVVEVTIEHSEEKIDLAEFIEAVLDFEDG